MNALDVLCAQLTRDLFAIAKFLLWTPAQRKRASMLYFANVFIYLFFYGRLILRPWLTEVRESFTRDGP